ncbi:MAG: DUF1700 domain-containing protein [Clostridia bacterium]|nr:DUF1700 domain-containing protein [Clostridia bacterium]
MNKEQFLFELRGRLAGLPLEDIERSLDFYREMIDDRIEDGMTEDEAVAAIGTPADAAAQILMEMPLPKVVKATAKPKRKLSGAEIALLCITAPIWGSILIGVLSALFGIYVGIWSVVIALYAAFGAALVSGTAVALFAAPAFIVQGFFGEAIFAIGAGLVCAAIGILGIMFSNLVAKGVVWLTKMTAKGIKSIFIKRGE